jgi:hypothetical protein
MAESNYPEAVLRARVAIDQVKLSRIATQSAIKRSRASLAEARSLLVALGFAVKNRQARPSKFKFKVIPRGEAQHLIEALTKIQNDN